MSAPQIVQDESGEGSFALAYPLSLHLVDAGTVELVASSCVPPHALPVAGVSPPSTTTALERPHAHESNSFPRIVLFGPLAAFTLGVTIRRMSTWDKCDFGTCYETTMRPPG
jgi:hypothetical protein